MATIECLRLKPGSLEFRAFDLKRTTLQAFVLRAESRFESIPIPRDPLLGFHATRSLAPQCAKRSDDRPIMDRRMRPP